LNVLRAQSLPEADFSDPASVLGHLNRLFKMDRQNNLIFTLWYGVLDVARYQLTYASGGHPPAVLIERPPGDAPRLRLLSTAGKVIGCDPEAGYRSETCTVPHGSVLYVFSDGVYEILRPDGRTLQLADLLEQLDRSVREQGTTTLEEIVAWTRNVRGAEGLEDDLSLMEVAL
jgi:sigma-B regulation protein RsbU (phosphoserine phosphatase)